jgi:hypothetical protein
MKIYRVTALKMFLFFLASLMVTAGNSSGLPPLEYRTIDGVGNNIANPDWGSAGVPLLRPYKKTSYDQGSIPPERPNPREISNEVIKQEGSIPISKNYNDMVWQWGQFVDHDIDITGPASPVEHCDIKVPKGDPDFDPDGTGNKYIFMDRSRYIDGTDSANPRQQINQITAFIDASNVYGSDDTTASQLRENDGSGCLRTSEGNLLPLDSGGFFLRVMCGRMNKLV